MADTLAKEVRLNGQQKRAIIVLIVVVIILLILWARKGGVTNNVTQQQLGPLNTTPQYINYSLPGLNVPIIGNSGDWDWMQTTDCACDCSCDDAVPQTPATIIEKQYAYIAGPTISPLPNINFPVYAAPPPMKWWLDRSFGYTPSGQGVLTIYRTQDGRKFSYSDNYRYMQAGIGSRDDIVVSGDNLYFNGVRYVHDYLQDNPGYVPMAGGS